MLTDVIKNKDAVLIKHKSNLSYAGIIVNVIAREQGLFHIVLKPSGRSELLICLPGEEIDRIYFKDGRTMGGEELNGYI